jgi:hypothetical protein
VKRPALLDSSYLIDLERETANAESALRAGFCRPCVGAHSSSRSSVWKNSWKARSAKPMPSPHCSGLPFKDYTSRRRDDVRCSSDGRPDGQARMTRGSSPLPNRSMPMWLQPTAAHSSDLGHATYAFDRRCTTEHHASSVACSSRAQSGERPNASSIS